MTRSPRVRHEVLRQTQMRQTRRAQGTRRGIVLLECIVALTILGSSLAGMMLLLAESDRVAQRAEAVDARYERADAFMHNVALWTKEDLDRRLGEREQGEWRLIVQRGRPTLYGIVLIDGRTRELLVRSSLYREESDDATP
jgi:type II secretory pathway pseudopilin PulG